MLDSPCMWSSRYCNFGWLWTKPRTGFPCQLSCNHLACMIDIEHGPLIHHNFCLSHAHAERKPYCVHGLWWELHCLNFSGWHKGKRFVCQAPFPMFVLAQGFALPDSQDMTNQYGDHLKVSMCRPHPRGVWVCARVQDEWSPEVLLHCSTATITVACSCCQRPLTIQWIR